MNSEPDSSAAWPHESIDARVFTDVRGLTSSIPTRVQLPPHFHHFCEKGLARNVSLDVTLITPAAWFAALSELPIPNI